MLSSAGESAGVRRSIVGWSAQRNMLGYDYVYAAKVKHIHVLNAGLSVEAEHTVQSSGILLLLLLIVLHGLPTWNTSGKLKATFSCTGGIICQQEPNLNRVCAVTGCTHVGPAVTQRLGC